MINNNKYRVLVIDDEVHIRKACRKALENKEFIVDTAGSVEEGKKFIKSRFYNVVLLDIKLPDISGDKFIRDIKYHYPGTEVIMITGYPDVETAISTMKAGAYDYLEKPFDIEKLRTLVKQAAFKGKVLIVDDDEGVLRTIKRIINEKFPEIEVRTADNIQKMKNLLKIDKSDILFLDIHLKYCDGLKAAKEIIKNNIMEPAKIVLMTGDTQADIKIESKKMGILQILIKPFTPYKIEEIINEKIKPGAEI
ncbi:MAG: response regulator [Elusimicrobia bacterium]|jgi:DNA-binding NtrC family response regulator|nr:response regulator [Elusimicrobiota bacterium]